MIDVGSGGWESKGEGEELQVVEEKRLWDGLCDESLSWGSVGVDIGRHELLEGFKVNCDLFEFDMILNAKGGC